MNVIIGNKQQYMLENLSIDIIKSLNGEFLVDDIIETFKNFFYQRMILDITALKDYDDIKTIQKLSISLDMSKLILLLDNTDSSSGNNDFLSKIISMGIYNFTKNTEGILYLYNTPNSYRDVAQYHNLDRPQVTTNMVTEYSGGNRVVGVKNLTDNAGATTFTYLMYKHLSKNYDAVAIEVGSNEFRYFSDKNLFSTTSDKLGNVMLQNNTKEVIIVDVRNDKQVLGMVNEMIYLVEPSTIKLNRMLYISPTIFKNIGTHKVILNQSFLSESETAELEIETKANFFYNMPPLNDRVSNNMAMNKFLYKLGFTRQEVGE